MQSIAISIQLYLPIGKVILSRACVIIGEKGSVHVGQLRIVSVVDPVVGALLSATGVPPSVLRILPSQLLHDEGVLVQTVHAHQVCIVGLVKK